MSTIFILVGEMANLMKCAYTLLINGACASQHGSMSSHGGENINASAAGGNDWLYRLRASACVVIIRRRAYRRRVAKEIAWPAAYMKRRRPPGRARRPKACIFFAAWSMAASGGVNVPSWRCACRRAWRRGSRVCPMRRPLAALGGGVPACPRNGPYERIMPSAGEERRGPGAASRSKRQKCEEKV